MNKGLDIIKHQKPEGYSFPRKINIWSHFAYFQQV